MTDKANILVVEDEAKAPSACHSVLTAAGYTATFSSGIQSLQNVDISSFNVVFMDFEGAGPGGFSLLEEIRHRQPAVEIIAITADPSLDHVKTAAKYGATEFVVKPLDPDSVTNVVRQALERSSWAIHPTRSALDPPASSQCWLEYVGDHQFSIGLERTFLKSTGAPIYVELPLEGQHVQRDDVLLRVLTRKGTIYAVGSPVTGSVLRVNEALLQDLDEIRDGGWAVRMRCEKPTTVNL